jgi:hypothetical protein
MNDLLGVVVTLIAVAVRLAWVRYVPTRPVGDFASSPGSPFTNGITATPVSNPDRPRASLGNKSSATPTISSGLPLTFGIAKSASRHAGIFSAWVTTS